MALFNVNAPLFLDRICQGTNKIVKQLLNAKIMLQEFLM
jgi:hypothetical protein